MAGRRSRESMGCGEQAMRELEELEAMFKLNSSSSSPCRSWWELANGGVGINRSTDSRDTDKIAI